MFLHQPIPGDGILPILRRFHANPDGIDLFNLLVVGAGKFTAILGRNHPAAIVYAPLDQRIAGVEIVLRLHVDDEGNLLAGAGGYGSEPDVIGDRPLTHRFVLGVHSADDCAVLVRQNWDGGHLGLALYVLLGNVTDSALFVFFQAGLHDPRQDRLFRQDALAGCIIARAVIRDVQPLSRCSLYVQILTFSHFILSQLCGHVHIFLGNLRGFPYPISIPPKYCASDTLNSTSIP